MKILVFCQYYYPERFLITDIAEKLVASGHEVTVVTGLPSYNFPNGKVPEEYRKGIHDEEIINGVKVIRCRIGGRGRNKISLLKNYFEYSKKATRVARKLSGDYDVVFAYQLTPVLQVKPAISYATKHNKKLLCYCLDLAPESGLRFLKKLKPLAKLYAKSSKEIYNSCDVVAVTSDSFIDYHNKVNGVPLEKLVYIPQHAPEVLLHQDLTKCRDEREKLTFLFAGNMGVGARLDTIVCAAGVLKDNNVQNFEIHFVGDGSDKANLQKLVKERRLDDVVKFFDGVPFDKMPDVYRTADALLISLRKGQITVPGKLQAYMSTGKPIFGAMDSAGSKMITEAECGLCVPAESPNALAECMERFIKDPEAFAQYGENGKRYFENNFTLERYTSKLLTAFDSLIV